MPAPLPFRSLPHALLAAALLALLPMAACHRPAPGSSSASAAGLPEATGPVVIAQRVSRTATEEIAGTVRSRQTAAIASKLTATILQLDAWPGQSVCSGDLLVVLDAREPEARLAQARALLEQALREETRLRGLAAQRAIASQELDNAVSRREVAEAGLREAQTTASHAQLTAPFDGVIVSRLAEAGDLAVPGRPLLVIEDPHSLRIETQVPESLVGGLRVGAELGVRIPSVAADLRARITEVSPAADPVSRTFLVKADLPPAEGLRSGQFGRVRIPVGEIECIELPQSAVVRRGQMEIVFVLDAAKGVVRQRLVRVGKPLPGDRVEILAGLDAGERVVTEGAAGLRDGQRFRVTEAKP